MHRLAARPHHLGSPYGKDNAEFIAGLFRSWGYDVAITDYQVLFPTPILRKRGAGGADEVRRLADRAAAQGGRHLQPGVGGAPALQRLLGRRRRHRRARLRQLRRARPTTRSSSAAAST